MYRKRILLVVPIALLIFTVLFAFGFAVFPTQASAPVGQLQITQVAPPAQITAVIPNTGNQTTVVNNGTGLSWVIWVILAIAVIALIVALVSRGGNPTYRE